MFITGYRTRQLRNIRLVAVIVSKLTIACARVRAHTLKIIML